MSRQELERLQEQLHQHLAAIEQEHTAIRQKLHQHADGKKLKGDEVVGWLGEIYGKLLLDGALVSDDLEYDLKTKDGKRISVKARKGKAKGWHRTSAIPKIDGDGCPSHLMFVHFNDNHSIDRIWLYPWKELRTSDRFKDHIVRGDHRSFFFQVRPKTDEKYIIYPVEMWPERASLK